MMERYKKGEKKMAKDRIEPCESYVCEGKCKKGRIAEHNKYCQNASYTDLEQEWDILIKRKKN